MIGSMGSGTGGVKEDEEFGPGSTTLGVCLVHGGAFGPSTAHDESMNVFVVLLAEGILMFAFIGRW